MKEVVVKRLYSVLVVVLLVALAVPTFAAPMPSKTAANQSLDSRAADLALVRDVAANQEVAKVLAARGLTGVRLSCQIPCDHDMSVRAISRLAGSGRADVGNRPADEITPPPQWVPK